MTMLKMMMMVVAVVVIMMTTTKWSLDARLDAIVRIILIIMTHR